MSPRDGSIFFREGARRRRGMTLVELMLALTITAFVAGAIAGMLSAVSAGVGTRRDVRSSMVRASTIQSRMSSYIIPARAVLDCTGDETAIWFCDANSNDRVNGAEIRWITYDADAQAVLLYFVDFPPSWTQTQIETANQTHSADSNWATVFNAYSTLGLIQTIELADALTDVSMSIDDAPLASRIIAFDLTFDNGDSEVSTRMAPSIRVHQPPAN